MIHPSCDWWVEKPQKKVWLRQGRVDLGRFALFPEPRIVCVGPFRPSRHESAWARRDSVEKPCESR
jgi:hypothetical protein